MIPKNITNFFTNPENIHNYNTRNRTSLRTVEHTTSLFNNSIFTMAPNNWSKISYKIRKLNNIKYFSKKIKENILSKY